MMKTDVRHDIFCLMSVFATPFLGSILHEWLIPSLPVSDFTQRLPLLSTLAHRCHRIAKGNDGQDLDILGNPQHRIDLAEIRKAGPVGADAQAVRIID